MRFHKTEFSRFLPLHTVREIVTTLKLLDPFSWIIRGHQKGGWI